ncbi:MAG TPA: hypothetical protein QGG93_04730 [Verrucomicrobiota bacterium]|nr:hypothetical protein [Verrucomicrobiota bacterium]
MPVRLKRRILLPAAFVWLGWLALGQTEALARQYCVTCHLFPEPSLLDKKTWISQVMPRMAIRMGLSPESVNQHPEADALWKSGRFMRVPLITQANQVHRGGTTFEESLFLPLNGAFRALARDYDEDGDTDIDLALGNYMYGPDKAIFAPDFLMKTWERSGQPVMILHNTLRSKPVKR